MDDESSLTKRHEKHREEMWGMHNWRSWGSWFSWGSPIGLGLFFVLVAFATWIFFHL